MTVRSTWTMTRIIDATAKIMDYRGRTPKKLGMEWGDGRIPAISARNVRMGRIDFDKEYYVASDSLYRRWMTQGHMEQGDTLITTEAPLGNVAAVPDSQRYVLSQRTVLLRPSPDLFDKTFFTQIMQSPAFQLLLTQNASGSTALGIQRKKLEQLHIPTPPLDEQRRIANALRDADDLITTLDRFIAKKQAIKQGMAQQLLTGKTRLPGFNQEWITGPMGKFMPLQRGFDLPTSQVRPGQYPVVYSNGIARFHDRALAGGPGVITGRSGTIGKVHYVDSDYWPHNTTLWVTNFKQTHPKFVYYFLTYLGLDRFASGSGVPTFNRNDAHSMEIFIPSDIDEQQAIAQALTDADAEIEVLRARLSKAKSIKHGMMQELLTGRIHLPAEVSS